MLGFAKFTNFFLSRNAILKNVIYFIIPKKKYVIKKISFFVNSLITIQNLNIIF